MLHQISLDFNTALQHYRIVFCPFPESAEHLPVLSVTGVGLYLDNLARSGGGGACPKNLSTFLKVCFLNFYMSFNLKSHNFKAKSESVYNLSRFATGRI